MLDSGLIIINNKKIMSTHHFVLPTRKTFNTSRSLLAQDVLFFSVMHLLQLSSQVETLINEAVSLQVLGWFGQCTRIAINCGAEYTARNLTCFSYTTKQSHTERKALPLD